MAALGGVYLIAFTSLRAQVKGLYGERGIRPVRTYLAAVRARIPAPRERWRRVPTIFWLDASDASLVRACRAGQIGSVLMMLGIAPSLLRLGSSDRDRGGRKQGQPENRRAQAAGHGCRPRFAR